MTTTVKVSRKLQVAVPAEARHALGIEAGDQLEVTVEGDALRLRLLPRDPLTALRQEHGGMWRGGSKWLEEERKTWSDPKVKASGKVSERSSRRNSRATG